MDNFYVGAKLLAILNQYARGRENAMPRDRVLGHLRTFIGSAHIGDRDFRELYAGLPVCSCEGGLYVPKTAEDVDAFESYMRKKVVPHWERVKRVREAYPEFAPPRGEQMDLF
jgi:hypothetical protein